MLKTYFFQLIHVRALPVLVLITFSLGFLSPFGAAQEVVRIAAIVNEEVISVLDLDNRARLVIATTNLPDRPDVLMRIKPQLIRAMVDERLQLQEAERFNIRITQREINGAIVKLAGRSRMQAEQLWSFLESRRIERSALENQVRARLSWYKLINHRFARQITIGPNQIKDEMARLRSLQGKPKMRVSEIFLNVDSPKNDKAIRQTAERLVQQIANGAQFSALAREFSQSTTAGKGGNLGWVTDSEMQTELAEVLRTMNPGQISQPIRTLSGYYIMYLVDLRMPKASLSGDKVEYRQMMIPIRAGASADEVERGREISRKISQEARSCNQFAEFGRRYKGLVLETSHSSLISEFSGPFKNSLMTQEIGLVAKPERTAEGFMLLVVCSRFAGRVDGPPLPSAKDLEKRLKSEKINLLAQRYMRDLRRGAYLDLRK